ncbi:hypothetical protein QNO07_27110 [Streptomyces sp. 549]|uniref:hypothetical protein n=1 Tax=Streptomyces sp. 549 TaxID=3049076 RepID=UPI0024C35D7D|nr:hypothetical protein [Streptomyces sp. 549]MDK1477020.1 hypothetical protein [Streptomyces sp. 549]
MTAALAAQPPEPDAQEGGWFVTVWDGLAGILPGGNLTMFGLLLLLGVYADAASKRKKTAGGPVKTRTPGSWKRPFLAAYGAVRSLVRAVWAVLRFYGGRELRGAPRSTATTWSAGTRLTTLEAPAASMASVALAPPRVSLVKKRRRQPNPWARQAAAWLTTYRGRGAAALDQAVRAALWTARSARTAWRVATTVYAAVAPRVRLLARTLGAWHCWPYAARGLVRVLLTAALVALLVPAWTGWALLVALASTVALGPLLPKLVPVPPGDDVVYGPKIWTILRDDLNLPDDEPRERWLQLPARLADPGARIVLRLPWTFRGSDLEKEAVSSLINSRLPGEWVGRYSFRGEHATAVYTHKPPPKPPAPAPAPPKAVDIEEPRIQEALANLAPDEFLLGVDEHNKLVIREMTGNNAHWAYSVGSGGGKSTTLQWLAVQMLMKGGIIVGVDPKLISLAPLEGIPGVYLYQDPQNGQDMREAIYWVAEVVMARFYEIKQGTQKGFPPLYMFLEESNELAGILRNVWNKIRVKKGDDKDPAADPIWEEAVGKILRFGRAANVHILAVFQDFKDNEFSGQSLRPLFPFKVLGSYDPHQWERITGMPKNTAPPNVRKAGLMVTVTNGVPFSYQTPYLFLDGEDGERRPATEEEAKDLYNKLYQQLRSTHAWNDHGLYSEPPEHSPEGIPKLLQGRVEGLSRDAGPNTPNGASEGGLRDETAGHGVTHPNDVTPGVTPQRDRLRLIPGQAGGQGFQDPLAAPVLLSVADIAREMQARGYDIEAGLIRTHKSRRDKGVNNGFPTGIGEGRDEKFTLEQLITYYEQRGIKKREESETEAEQGDAV